MSDPTSIKPRFLSLALVSALAACSNDVVDLGGGTLSQNVELGSRCTESVIVEGDVHVTNQEELDALLGCEEIRGGLRIEIFEGTDLGPLGELRAVDGDLFIGSYPDFSLDLTPEAIEAYQLEYERVTAIAEANWLPSLEGVESLERVGGLSLNRLSAPSLEAFESLRLVSGSVDTALAGQLAITAAPNLVDLGGLENVRGFRVVAIADDPALESLSGLQVGASLNDLSLQNLPALTNIDALAALDNVTFDITIVGTAIPDVDALSNLRWAALGLALFDNPELTNVDGLAGLVAADFLVFDGNARLEHLPEFTNLFTLDSFKLMNNPALESLSLSFPSLQAINIIDGNDVPLAAGVFEIGGNARLQTLAVAGGLRAAEVLSIYRNDSLASIDLGSLERIDRLDIYGNTALAGVALGALQTVDSLRIIGNPSLSTAELRTVRTFASEIVDNADDPPAAL
jgi:hypothetical protein